MSESEQISPWASLWQPILAVVLIALGLAAVGYFVWPQGDGRSAPIPDSATGSIVIDPDLPPLPKVGLPGVVAEEEELLAVTTGTARELNGSRPFSTAKNTPARPFGTKLAGADRDRAITCLAVAGLYEAGSGGDDQMPVMQVVLNRVRHPAFPKTVCGVVFQGSERRTGCQFSFTCDGSIGRRRPSAAAMEQARARAGMMLDQVVDKRVGLATHFHTDWVLPYWSSSLDKITAVKTHIFFRWKGFWGTQASFRNRPLATEPVVSRLAGFSAAHSATDSDLADGEETDENGEDAAELADGVDGDASQSVDADFLASNAPAAAVQPRTAQPRPNVVEVTLSPDTKPGRWALDALARCGSQRSCRAVGWLDPARRPATLDRAGLTASPPDFVLVQDLRNRVQQPYWDCARFPRASTSRCLNGGGQAANLVFAP